jgi:L-fuculose-phosphate aldolase
MSTTDLPLRQSIIAHCREMNASGLNQGTSGNISVRAGDGMLITPSAVPYDVMTPDMIAAVPLGDISGLDTAPPVWEGPLKPSTEWRFHRDILKARPEINAVVHTHSPFATILAIAGKSIPACHYMVAAFGGPDIRLAPYATFGTAELSAHAVSALHGRLGCLLANHGMIAIGPTLERAMWLAVELETIARQYYHCLVIGGAVILDDDEIERVRARFAGYGVHATAVTA